MVYTWLCNVDCFWRFAENIVDCTKEGALRISALRCLRAEEAERSSDEEDIDNTRTSQHTIYKSIMSILVPTQTREHIWHLRHEAVKQAIVKPLIFMDVVYVPVYTVVQRWISRRVSLRSSDEQVY